jgi:DNA repair protein RadC
MKEVAPHDRPREKLARLGCHGLGDNELLALVVGSGCRSADALALANRLLASVGGLPGLTRAAAGELCRVPGVGPVRAGRILAAVELGRRTLLVDSGDRPRLTSPRQLAALLLPRYGACPVEQFGVVLLDTRRRVIRIKVLSIGSLDMTVVHPREVFREAATASAAAVALFHNHPSGDPEPSRDDLELTARMLRAGEVMGIEVIDHIILADQRYVSLSEVGGLIRRAGSSGLTG